MLHDVKLSNDSRDEQSRAALIVTAATLRAPDLLPGNTARSAARRAYRRRLFAVNLIVGLPGFFVATALGVVVLLYARAATTGIASMVPPMLLLVVAVTPISVLCYPLLRFGSNRFVLANRRYAVPIPGRCARCGYDLSSEWAFDAAAERVLRCPECGCAYEVVNPVEALPDGVVMIDAA